MIVGDSPLDRLITSIKKHTDRANSRSIVKKNMALNATYALTEELKDLLDDQSNV